MNRSRSGFILITVLFVSLAIAVLVIGASFTSLIDRRVAANQRGATAAYYAALTGIEQIKTQAFRNLVAFYSEDNGWVCVPPLQDELLFGDERLPRGATLRIPSTGLGDNGTAYSVSYDIIDGLLVLRSVGEAGRESQSTVQLVAAMGTGPTGVWENAIFAEGSQTPTGTGAINGNVAVYGSVQIVDSGVNIETGLNFSGSAGVFNNYLGNNGQNNSDIGPQISDLVGSSVAAIDLCTRIKIASGDLVLAGSAQGGASPLAGENYDDNTNRIYGIHLGQGHRVYSSAQKQSQHEITQHSTADNAKAFLRYPSNGVVSSYDAVELDMPPIPSDYPNEPTQRDRMTLDTANAGELGATCSAFFGTAEYGQGNQGVTQASIVIPPPGGAPARCENGSAVLEWTSDGRLLVQGDINLGSLGLNVTGPVEYLGQGNLRVGANATDSTPRVAIAGSLQPAGGTYLDSSFLGVTTSGDVSLSGQPSDTIASLVYSAGSVSVSGQVLVAGAIVTDTLIAGTGNNVPKVAFHPQVANAAEALCLFGSRCSLGDFGNPGRLRDISLERL